MLIVIWLVKEENSGKKGAPEYESNERAEVVGHIYYTNGCKFFLCFFLH